MPGASPLSALLADAAHAPDVARRDAAFSELLRLVSIFVRAGMGKRLRDHRESLDVCQSVAKSFVDDFESGRLTFENEAALSAYLKQVVRTKLAELARTDGAINRGAGRPGVAIDDSTGVEPAGSDWTASLKAAATEDFDRVMSSLTEEERTLVRLRAAGTEWDQIGETLGRDSAAIRQQFSRLQKRVAGMLE